MVALLQINDAQLSDTDKLIRCFAMVTNLLAFLCCLFVIRHPNMNQGNARILSRMSRIASALSVMGFVPILAIGPPSLRESAYKILNFKFNFDRLFHFLCLREEIFTISSFLLQQIGWKFKRFKYRICFKKKKIIN